LGEGGRKNLYERSRKEREIPSHRDGKPTSGETKRCGKKQKFRGAKRRNPEAAISSSPSKNGELGEAIGDKPGCSQKGGLALGKGEAGEAADKMIKEGNPHLIPIA